MSDIKSASADKQITNNTNITISINGAIIKKFIKYVIMFIVGLFLANWLLNVIFKQSISCNQASKETCSCMRKELKNELDIFEKIDVIINGVETLPLSKVLVTAPCMFLPSEVQEVNNNNYYYNTKKEPYGAPSGAKSRIVLKATDESWLNIKDSDDETIFSRVLVRGDSYNVPDNNNYIATVGNAGAIDVYIDGKIAPKLGAPHTRKSGILLTPEALKYKK